MGHVTYIANKLLEAGMQSEQMRTYLDAHTPWQVCTQMIGYWHSIDSDQLPRAA